MKCRITRLLACAAAISTLAISMANATVYYVKLPANGGNNSYNGLSWSSAKATVQAALSLAVSGDQVWVRCGQFDTLSTLTVPSGVGLYGGFAGTETSLSQRPAFPRPDTDPYRTMLNCNCQDSIITIPFSATASTIVDGFFMNNGYGYVANTNQYGGSVIVKTGAAPVIRNNIMQGGLTSGPIGNQKAGGAIYSANASPTIQNNIMRWNVLGIPTDEEVDYTGRKNWGGALYLAGGSPIVIGNTIHSNGLAHAAIFIQTGTAPGTPQIIGNTITGNKSEGIHCYTGTTPVIDENVISGNQWYHKFTMTGTTPYWTAIQVLLQDSSATVQNNKVVVSNNLSGLNYSYGLKLHTEVSSRADVIRNNWIYGDSTDISTTGSYGIHVYNAYTTMPSHYIICNTIARCRSAIWAVSGTGTVANNILSNCYYGLALAGTHRNNLFNCTVNYFGGITPGLQELIGNPLFVNLATADFHIQTGSPAIDTAWASAPYLPADDIDGWSRPYGAGYDMGACERH